MVKKMKVRNYIINEDLIIDVKKDVNLHRKKLTELPVKFNKVNGGFDCSENKLTSLEHCSEKVKGHFECSYNELTSLEHCLKIINGNFDCSENKLTSLEHCPKRINGNFYCHHNDLTSLKYCPEKIEKNFYCSYNNINKKSLYLFNSDVKGHIYNGFGNKEDFLKLVELFKNIKKEKLNKIINPEINSSLIQKRL